MTKLELAQMLHDLVISARKLNENHSSASGEAAQQEVSNRRAQIMQAFADAAKPAQESEPFDIERAKKGDPIEFKLRIDGNYVWVDATFVGVSSTRKFIVIERERGPLSTQRIEYAIRDDLRMKAPETRTVYINWYNGDANGVVHATESAAREGASSAATLIACPVKIPVKK